MSEGYFWADIQHYSQIASVALMLKLLQLRGFVMID